MHCKERTVFSKGVYNKVHSIYSSKGCIKRCTILYFVKVYTVFNKVCSVELFSSFVWLSHHVVRDRVF